MLKALTALQLARRTERELNVPAVAIFWVEAEDHDWEEVRSCTVLDAEFQPRTVTLDQPSFSHYGLHSGARYAFGRYRVGASYIHYWYDIPTITDSITFPPSNIKGDGTNNIFSLSIEAAL